MRKLIVLALFSAFSSSAFAAANCSIDITANDAMQFSTKEITVDKSCKDFTVNLKHVGKLPKKAMGHNWMLTSQADMKAVATESQKAVATEYHLVNDPRVVAATKLLGGGESDSITFSTSKLTAGTPYAFFCSFPGHSGVMKGTLTVK